MLRWEAPGPISLVTVTYIRWSACGVDLAVSEVGMVCEAGSWSSMRRCVCWRCDWILLWHDKGMDANWGNLVVQPFLGLVYVYDVGSDSDMLAERCLVGSEICDWGRMCACSIHAPVTHCQTPPTHIQPQTSEANLH